MGKELIIPKHGLEHDHIPVPAEHTPCLDVVFDVSGVYVFEHGDPDSYLMAENPVEIVR